MISMDNLPSSALPSIPAKRYFTIGEVGDLCGVKPHVLRYWEQEFTQLRPMKRRGNRRYYQHHEVLMIRRIRDLLYDQGFTISGARNRLQEIVDVERDKRHRGEPRLNGFDISEIDDDPVQDLVQADLEACEKSEATPALRRELMAIRDLLSLPLNTAIMEG